MTLAGRQGLGAIGARLACRARCRYSNGQASQRRAAAAGHPGEDRQAMATQLRRNSDCSDAEWTARQELAACYRIFEMQGWSESIYNHISVRVPGEDDAFLINPYGLLWSEVTASNLVKIDSDGNKLCSSPYPVNKAGFTQHGLFHRHLDWAHAIVHTHTPDTMAVCSSAEGLTPTNFYACFFEGAVGYHDFEGITVR